MSNCDNVCIGTADDYDMPEFYSVADPVARKPVVCCECHRTVPVGTRYHKAVGKWEGVLNVYRQCSECHEIQVTFSCGRGYYFEQLWESFFDFGFEGLTVRNPCFQSLSLSAKAHLTEMWWKWKEHKLK